MKFLPNLWQLVAGLVRSRKKVKIELPDTAGQTALDIEQASLSTGQQVAVNLGRNSSTRNRATIRFHYAGSESTSNRLDLLLQGLASLSLYGDLRAVFPGNIEGANITGSGAVQGNSVAATAGVTGATVTATGAVQGNSVAATAGVTGATVTVTGAAQAANLNIVTPGTAGIEAIKSLQAALAAGQSIYFTFGRDQNTGNRAVIRFYYAGSSSTSNRIEIAQQGRSAIVLYGDGRVALPGQLFINPGGTSVEVPAEVLGDYASGEVLSNTSTYDASSTFAIMNNWYTVGPTGSGADYTTSILDGVPSTAKWVKVMCCVNNWVASGLGMQRYYASFLVEGGNGTATAGEGCDASGYPNNSGAISLQAQVPVWVPLGPNRVFRAKAKWISSITFHQTGFRLLGWRY